MKICGLCGRRFSKGDDTIALRMVSDSRLTLAPRPMCPQCGDKQERRAAEKKK